MIDARIGSRSAPPPGPLVAIATGPYGVDDIVDFDGAGPAAGPPEYLGDRPPFREGGQLAQHVRRERQTCLRRARSQRSVDPLRNNSYLECFGHASTSTRAYSTHAPCVEGMQADAGPFTPTRTQLWLPGYGTRSAILPRTRSRSGASPM